MVRNLSKLRCLSSRDRFLDRHRMTAEKLLPASARKSPGKADKLDWWIRGKKLALTLV